MKKGFLLAVYVVIAAVIIGVGAYYSDKFTQSGQSSNQETQSQTMDSLKVTDDVVGTGTVAANGDTVTVNYTGTLDNGTVFDSSLNAGRTPFVFTLGAGQVIKGWDQGVLGMKVGGTRELVIPSDLGYGSQGAGTVIPPNATLHFKIELLSVSGAGASAGQ